MRKYMKKLLDNTFALVGILFDFNLIKHGVLAALDAQKIKKAKAEDARYGN